MVMDRRPLALVFSAGILAATAVLFVLVPRIHSNEDTGQIQGTRRRSKAARSTT